MNSVKSKSYKNIGNPAVLCHIPDEATSILDVGCGAGDNARLLGRSDRVIDGVTLSPTERDAALQYCRHVAIHDLEKGLPPEVEEPYDCVICSHVLEHICWPSRLLEDIRKSLKPNGVLVVALPNLLFYRNRWNILRGRFEYQETGLMDNTHFRWYSFHSAQELLRKAGYEVVSAEADGSFPIPCMRRFLPACLTRAVDRIACRAFPGLFGYQLVLAAKVEHNV